MRRFKLPSLRLPWRRPRFHITDSVLGAIIVAIVAIIITFALWPAKPQEGTFRPEKDSEVSLNPEEDGQDLSMSGGEIPRSIVGPENGLEYDSVKKTAAVSPNNGTKSTATASTTKTTSAASGAVPSSGSASGTSVSASASGTAAKSVITVNQVKAPAPVNDACNNAYYPVSKDYRIEYSWVVKNKVVPAFTSIVDRQRSNTARETFDFGNDSLRQDVTCEAGRIVPTQYVDLTTVFGDQKFNVTTKQVVGELIGLDLSQGKQWKLRYYVSVKATDKRLTDQGVKTATYVIDETRKVVSFNETLTSPAGTFEIVRLQVDQTVTVQLPGGFPTRIDPVKRTYYAYYGKHAGLLRLVEPGKWDLVATKAGF